MAPKPYQSCDLRLRHGLLAAILRPFAIFALPLVTMLTGLEVPAGASSLGPIPVVFEPVTGASNSVIGSASAKALSTLISSFNSSNGYRNYFAPCTPSSTTICKNASILVVTTLAAAGADGKYPVSMTAYFLGGSRPPVTVSFTADLSAADPSNAFNLQDTTLMSLLGTPVLYNGTLTVEGYSPYMQLLPETATDRKYIGLLGAYFSARRIATIPSQYTGVGDQGGSNGTTDSTSICANSPRYFDFTVAVSQAPRMLGFETLVRGVASGKVVDCVNPGSRITVSTQQSLHLVTSKAPTASLVNILSLLFITHNSSWTYVATDAAAASSFIDDIPNSTPVEERIYAMSLQGLVDNFCLLPVETAHTETIPATPPDSKNPSDAITQPVGPSTASSSNTPLSVTGITMGLPPSLKCEPNPIQPKSS